MTPIDIAIALIRRNDGAYLLTRRLTGAHLGGMWEFPGGRVEPGESIEEAIKREVAEELGIEIELGQALDPIEHEYPDRAVRLHPYYAKPMPREKPVALGCEEFSWVPPEKLHSYEFPKANDLLVRLLDPTFAQHEKRSAARKYATDE